MDMEVLPMGMGMGMRPEAVRGAKGYRGGMVTGQTTTRKTVK